MLHDDLTIPTEPGFHRFDRHIEILIALLSWAADSYILSNLF